MRSAVKEQIESLGAKFLDLGLEEDAEGTGGYAKELAEEQQRKQQEALAEALRALRRRHLHGGRPRQARPLLLTAQAVKNMKPGSVIVDLAAETGGNCELTEAGETVDHDGVKVIGP